MSAARLVTLLPVALLLLSPEVWAQRMSFLHTPPPLATAGKELPLVGNIFGAGEDLARARCRYRQRGGSWKQVELALEYGDLYRAVIPARDVVPPSIEYYCVAFDFFGGQTELFGSASSPRRVKVTGEYAGADDDARPEDRKSDEKKPEEKKPDERRADERKGEERKGKDRPTRDPDDGPQKSTRRTAPPPDDDPPAAAPRSSGDEELALFGAEDVVTLATRQAQSVTDAPAIATGVPEEQMRALGLRTLPDVAKTVPGFETSRDVQGFHRFAARGIRDEGSLLVLYDGHKLNSPYDARALVNVPVENAERVEVVRGPGSALYGTGAFLGVVNIASKRRETVEAAVSGGSFGTFDGHVSAGHRLSPDLMVFADVDLLRTDGYRRGVRRDSLSSSLENAGVKDPDQNAGLTNDKNLFANVGGELRYGTVAEGQSRLALRYLREDRGALVGLFDSVGPESRLTWDVILADAIHERAIPYGTVTGRLYFDHQIADRLFQIAPANFRLSPTSSAPKGLFERTRFSAQTFGTEGNVALTLLHAHKLSLGVSASLERLPSYAYEVNFAQTTVFDTLQRPAALA
ncbi:MAG: TonB-dependent receptor plug domain-containing protein, partial [Myxococcales bacterium]